MPVFLVKMLSDKHFYSEYTAIVSLKTDNPNFAINVARSALGEKEGEFYAWDYDKCTATRIDDPDKGVWFLEYTGQ